MLRRMQAVVQTKHEPSEAVITVGVGVSLLVGALVALLVVVAMRRRRERLRRASPPTMVRDAWAESGRRMETGP